MKIIREIGQTWYLFDENGVCVDSDYRLANLLYRHPDAKIGKDSETYSLSD